MNVAKSTLKPLATPLKPLSRLFESNVDEEASSESSEDDVSVFMEDEKRQNDETEEIARKESRRVNVWRFLVIGVLLAAGATTSVLTFQVLSEEEEDDFEHSYNLFVRNIEDAGTASIRNVQRAFTSLSESITAASIANNEPFPFVTVPSFEIIGEHARRLSGVELVAYSPLVQETELLKWIQYSNTNQGWLKESREIVTGGDQLLISTTYLEGTIAPAVYQHEFDENGQSSEVLAYTKPFLPIWQVSPPPFYPGFVNYNIMADSFTQKYFPLVEATRRALLMEVFPTKEISRLGSTAINLEDHKAFHDEFEDKTNPANNATEEDYGFSHPHSVYIVPVFKELANPSSPLAGVIFGVLPWDYYLKGLLPDGVVGVYFVIENTCGQQYTYKLNGASAIYLGEGDLHDTKYNYMKRTFDVFNPEGLPEELSAQICSYRFQLYPSDELSDEYNSTLPWVLALVVGASFFLMAVTFFMYDRFVKMRNEKVVSAAVRSNRIVSSLFPSNIRDRLLAEEEEAEKREEQHGTQTRLKQYLANDGPAAGDMEMDDADDIMFKTKPIADLFPETTVLFADIAGFTAWSSAREPSQVFTLLETVYRSFDEIAKRRRVFKVETVGDCYVAATGLPEPRVDHAVAMARFAKDCMNKMQALTRKLEVSLGPDTADLAMRMGLHSGPVTAGVLRAERSRFQLFGDTMNMAAKMEHTGIRDKIQISQETADLLVASGKKAWISPREDLAKGEARTYWLELSKSKSSDNTGSRISPEDGNGDHSHSSDDMSEDEEEEAIMRPTASAKIARLIDWNVDVLLRLLKSIVARRQARGITASNTQLKEDFTRSVGMTVLDEVEERIALPEFEPDVAKRQLAPEQIDLDPSAETQLYEYVAAIAAMYRDNPFHNFEHASHVTMSVSKLLSRIIAPTDLDFHSSAAKNQSLHDHTYGITSDPLTQFACVLSALIHDVDHTGVPNTQLVKENSRIASYYKGRSVAEQNSVDVAWDLLFDECYADLRRTIYTTNEEIQRFRKLVVNSVMATDIMDKELKELRNARWDRAFAENANEDPLGTTQRKATIVIEHLIQASDVAHTMQHWHIYRKWNARLFEELYKAYKEGRSEKNPADFWAKGEIGFFDFYIIPLAKKLKECGVFGVSSDEYLNYAEHNRKEWEARGQEVVSELLETVAKKYDFQPASPAAPESSDLPPTGEIELKVSSEDSTTASPTDG